MVFVIMVFVLFMMVLVTITVVILAAVVIISVAVATTTTTSRGGGRSCDVVGIQRHCAAQCKNSAHYTSAGSHGVTGEGDQISHEGTSGTESGGAANLPEHIASQGAAGQDDRGIARCRKRAAYLENIDTVTAQCELSCQLSRGIETIDARRKGLPTQILASQVGIAGLS